MNKYSSADGPVDAVTKPVDAVTKPVDAVTKPVDAVTRPVDAVTETVDADFERRNLSFLPSMKVCFSLPKAKLYGKSGKLPRNLVEFFPRNLFPPPCKRGKNVVQ
jgi:hypothetical protein